MAKITVALFIVIFVLNLLPAFAPRRHCTGKVVARD
jgi:hypothetical protein